MLRRRAEELGVAELHLGVEDKATVFDALVARLGLNPAQAACIGDDLLDLPLFRRAGLALAVSDAAAEARAAAHYVTRRPGGRGAVREAVELILKAQGHWRRIVEEGR
jgi:3-deoxy-D-manno-octulosonate 8-phosphate phosphatase (KDO 8-P phosphatase)